MILLNTLARNICDIMQHLPSGKVSSERNEKRKFSEENFSNARLFPMENSSNDFNFVVLSSEQKYFQFSVPMK